jgi:hypothetical protein
MYVSLDEFSQEISVQYTQYSIFHQPCGKKAFLLFPRELFMRIKL